MTPTHPTLPAPPDRWNPYVLAAVAVAVSAVLVPRFCYDFDVYGCWVAWADASGGTRPWDVYRTQVNCNYPPVLLYLWTVTAAVTQLLPTAHRYGWTLQLYKMPNVLAWVAGVPLCDLGLRRAWGRGPARAAAVAYALCLPLLLDAAVWGQYDAVLCLAMIGCLVALVNDRPVLAGAIGGLALGVKFQAVVIGPAAAVYAVRRFGVARAAAAAAAAVGVLVAVSAPFVVAGQGKPMAAAYAGAVGFYPYLTLNAANVWQPVRLFNIFVRHLPGDVAISDAVRWAGPVTPKRVGLALFAGYTLLVSGGLWRRPDGVMLVRAAGLTAFGFFMLPTQMHERYVVPAAVLLALPVGFAGVRGRPSNWWLYVALAASAAAQLALQQYMESLPPPVRNRHGPGTVRNATLAALSVVDVALLLWATAGYLIDAWRPVPTGTDDRIATDRPEATPASSPF